MSENNTGGDRAFLVGLDLRSAHGALDVGASLEELALLVDTAGIEVVGQTTQRLKHPDPATYIGSGKVEEVRNWIMERDANVVIFDDELSPRHQRELEKVFGESVRVVDRTTLILDIFAQHAHTKEGALQVSLAQYDYLLPRLTRQWTHLARQAGGGGGRGGVVGVGLRGPGEMQLETDRREIRRKISTLKRELEGVRAHRQRHRAQRRRTGTPVVALVGYTNAGKSTLLNRLSGSDVFVADQLFATLDPTTRRVELPGGREVLFTDTVGLIQKLPHTLIAAFRATLEEITDAAIILHLVDVTNPYASEHVEVVKTTLRDDLEIKAIPTVMIFNKIDDISTTQAIDHLEELRALYPGATEISARNGTGIDHLLLKVGNLLGSFQKSVILRLPYSEGALISRFHELGSIETVKQFADAVEIVGMISPEHLGPYLPYIKE